MDPARAGGDEELQPAFAGVHKGRSYLRQAAGSWLADSSLWGGFQTRRYPSVSTSVARVRSSSSSPPLSLTSNPL